MLPSRLLSHPPFITGPRRRPIKHLADLGPLPATAARERGQERASTALCPLELSPVIYRAAAAMPSAGSQHRLNGEEGRESWSGTAMPQGRGRLFCVSAGQAVLLNAPPGSTLGLNFPADYTHFQRE